MTEKGRYLIIMSGEQRLCILVLYFRSARLERVTRYNTGSLDNFVSFIISVIVCETIQKQFVVLQCRHINN